jgi:hypothetical protein
VGLAWSYDPEIYTCSSLATGRDSHTSQVKGDDPDKKAYPDSSGLELGVGIITYKPYKQFSSEKLKKHDEDNFGRS